MKRKNKHWEQYVLENKSTKNIEDDFFYTTDTNGYLIFELMDRGFFPTSAEITLFNTRDGSVINESVEIIEKRIEYHIRPEIMAHAGSWQVQVVYILDNKSFTAKPISFTVTGHLMDKKEPALEIISNWNTFMISAREFMSVWEGDHQIWEDRLENLEAEYAPRLDEVTSQLAQSATKEDVHKTNERIHDFNDRVDEIITTPAEGINEQEIIDARQGKGSLGANITSVKQRLNDYKEGYATQFPLFNLVENGDFSNGIDDWVGSSAVLDVIGNTLQVKQAGYSLNGSVYQDFNIPLSHSVYTKVRFRVTNPDCNRLEVQFRGSESGTTNKVLTSINPVENRWYEVSVVETPDSNLAGDLRVVFSHYYHNLDSAAGKLMEVENVMVFDLTKTFGAGNEPNVEEVDEMLKYYDVDWFDNGLPIKDITSKFKQELKSTKDLVFEEGSFPAENIVRNSDFSNGTSEWIGANSKVEDGWFVRDIANFQGGLAYTIYQNYNENVVEGHKYYVSVVTKLFSLDEFSGGNVRVEYDGSSAPSQNLTIGDEIKFSSVFTKGTSGNRLAARFWFNSPASGSAKFGIKYPLILDLTKIFGVGNEPEEEEMNQILSKYQNEWFERTTSIINTRDMLERINKGVSVESTKKYHFTDELIGTYSASNIDTFGGDATKSNEVYSKFDELVSEFPNQITKEELGTEPTGLPINKYVFKPQTNTAHSNEIKLPKVIILSSVHGNEKGPVYSTYNIMSDIYRNWKTDKILEFFRFNVEFTVVPLVNPYAFNQEDWTAGRYNSNGVDLNRNSPEGWDQSDVTSGDSPASEIETQLIINLIDELNPDYVIDFHNMGWRDGYMGYVLTDNKTLDEVTNRTIGTLGRKWQKDYDFFPQDEGHIFGYTSTPPGGSFARQATSMGLDSVLIEVQRRIEWKEGYRNYDELTITCGNELLVNQLKGLIKLIS